MAFVNVGITHACCCIFEESSGQSLPNACGFVAGSWAGLGRCEYSTNQHPCIEHLIFSWVVNLIKMAKQNIPNLDHLEQFHAMTVPLAANFYTVLQPFFLIILICLPSQFQVRNSKLLLIFNATDLLGATSSMHECMKTSPAAPWIHIIHFAHAGPTPTKDHPLGNSSVAWHYVSVFQEAFCTARRGTQMSEKSRTDIGRC